MKRLKFTLSRATLERLYLTLIRPILEYGCVIFDACSLADTQLLESVQYNAARTCTGAIWNTNRTLLLNDMGWETLETRRKSIKLTLLFKMKNNLVPPYLSQILTPLVSSVHNYPLRNVHQFRIPKVVTARYKRAFLPSTISLWNQLPVDVTSHTDLPVFKRAVMSFLFHQKSPAHWRIGERSLSIFHTRLRLGLSGLNAHLYAHGLSQNSTCECGCHLENTSHYFFSCPLFAAHRPGLLLALTQSIQQIDNMLDIRMLNTSSNLELLLKGSVYLSYDNNVALFNAVQTYILKTRRFL